jgi:predicted acylesterase/phospholipase RssA
MEIGLVLEGGGAKGAFCQGFVAACHAKKIRFAAVSGTSVGGLTAWIVATGQYEKGNSFWPDLTFERIYEPRIQPWKAMLPLLLLFHAFAHWANGLSPHPDKGSRWNHALIALFRTVVFVPLLIFYLGLVDAPSWLAYTLMAVALGYCLFPCTRMRNSAEEQPLTVVDDEFEGMAQQLILLLVLAFGVSLMIAIYRIVTGAGNYIDFFAIGYALVALCAVFAASAANLADTPLMAIIDDFLAEKPEIPCFVTTAERVERFDSAHPKIIALSSDPTDPLEYRWAPSALYLPTYHALLPMQDADRRTLLRATAALPFGLVNSVDFRGSVFVDGGMADNIPLLPLVSLKLDLIVVVRLNPADGKDDGQMRAEVEADCRRMALLPTLLSEVCWIEPSKTEGAIIRRQTNAPFGHSGHRQCLGYRKRRSGHVVAAGCANAPSIAHLAQWCSRGCGRQGGRARCLDRSAQ